MESITVLILVIILVVYLRLNRTKLLGKWGEKKVSLLLGLLGNGYKVFNDVIIRNGNWTSQIDHLIISHYGLFVIETKNYKGWIFGSETASQWTQNIYGKKNRFMNPIHQNYAHVKAIEALLSQEYPLLPIFPIVAFSSEATLKFDTNGKVVTFRQLARTIRSHQDKVLDSVEMTAIVEWLRTADINSADVKKEHVQMIKARKKEKSDAVVGSSCPQCGGTLVERKGKNGAFIGCSNFPKCRFTKRI